MTAKSIIDIEVRDQAFKDFAALFAKYQKPLLPKCPPQSKARSIY